MLINAIPNGSPLSPRHSFLSLCSGSSFLAPGLIALGHSSRARLLSTRNRPVSSPRVAGSGASLGLCRRRCIPVSLPLALGNLGSTGYDQIERRKGRKGGECARCTAGSWTSSWLDLAPSSCRAVSSPSALTHSFLPSSAMWPKGNHTIITPFRSAFTQPASFHPIGTVAPLPHVAMHPCCLASSAASERPISSSSIGLPSSTSQRRRRPVLLETWDWQ